MDHRSVSYTHLDVYKRQALCTDHFGDELAGFRQSQRPGEGFWLCAHGGNHCLLYTSGTKKRLREEPLIIAEMGERCFLLGWQLLQKCEQLVIEGSEVILYHLTILTLIKFVRLVSLFHLSREGVALSKLLGSGIDFCSCPWRVGVFVTLKTLQYVARQSIDWRVQCF